MEKFFHLKENGTTVKTEVLAGITTFLAMAYILAVNPNMLGATGMNSQGVFMATALAAATLRESTPWAMGIWTAQSQAA